MNVHLTATQVLAGVGVLLALAWVWRAGTRRARQAADAARSGARLLSITGRVAFMASLIVAVQWLVLTHPSVNGWAVLAALGLPALLASYTLTRALTVATMDVRRRGGRR
jgi:drug/metabolite transporter (DMT)-like permease